MQIECLCIAGSTAYIRQLKSENAVQECNFMCTSLQELESKKDVADKLSVEEQSDEEIHFPEMNSSVAEQREENIYLPFRAENGEEIDSSIQESQIKLPIQQEQKGD